MILQQNRDTGANTGVQVDREGLHGEGGRKQLFVCGVIASRPWREVSRLGVVGVEMCYKLQRWTSFRAEQLDIRGGCMMRIMKVRSILTAELEGNCRTMQQTPSATIKCDPDVIIDRSEGPK